MKNIARESIMSVYGSIDPHKKDNTFEVSLIQITYILFRQRRSLEKNLAKKILSKIYRMKT